MPQISFKIKDDLQISLNIHVWWDTLYCKIRHIPTIQLSKTKHPHIQLT